MPNNNNNNNNNNNSTSVNNSASANKPGNSNKEGIVNKLKNSFGVNKSGNLNKEGNSNKQGNSNKPGIANKLKNSFGMAQNKAKNTYEDVKPKLDKTQNFISKQYESGKDSVTNMFSGFQSSSIGQQLYGFMKVLNDFAENNSTIAKVIFVLFMFIIFGLLFRLGVYILTLFFAENKNPVVLKGMRSTLTKKIYRVNPNLKDPKPILRSINENQGMEFTWSSWIWINSTDYDDTSPRLFFSKGQTIDSYETTDASVKKPFVMNSPGLYLYDKNQDTGQTNSISVVISFFDNEPISGNINRPFYDVITINNMPMQKWVNVIIRVQSKIVDIYINGTLTKRKEYDRVVKQNYGDILVGSQKFGADAYISSLRYFAHAIGNNTIQDILYQGPNLKMDGTEMMETKPPYLAMKWYLDEPANQPGMGPGPSMGPDPGMGPSPGMGPGPDPDLDMGEE